MLPDLVKSLKGFIYTDVHCEEDSGYHVYSVYCDSPCLSFFWEKIEGIKFRRKVRFRKYREGKNAFLEIKQRTDQTVQKRRSLLSMEQITRIINSDSKCEDVDDLASDDQVTSETLFLWRYYNLQPNMAISYTRRAFFSIYEPDLRITFDTRVQYHARDNDISKPFEAGKYIIEPDKAIMEIKFSERVPLWLCKIVSRYEASKIRLSKYCTAIDREYYNNSLT
jgi:hypothetical protein